MTVSVGIWFSEFEFSLEWTYSSFLRCVPLLVPPDDRSFLETAAEIYAKHDRYSEALALAVQMNDRTLIRKYFDAPTNPSVWPRAYAIRADLSAS
jgi:26S proteasome regulatory subunit N1